MDWWWGVTYSTEQRHATTPPNTIGDGAAMLMWTDPPYGLNKVMAGTAAKYTDTGTTELVLDTLNAWVPKMGDNATIVVCLDYRLVHHVAARFEWVLRGEIIWGFGLGAPRQSWWPVRHNTLLTFTRTTTSGMFDRAAQPRQTRLAPKKGYTDDKPAGSIWDFTMSNTHPDRRGYPNQKPVEIITPFINAHTAPGDLVVDPFMGGGSTGVAALRSGRRFWGGDISPDAVTNANTVFASMTGGGA